MLHKRHVISAAVAFGGLASAALWVAAQPTVPAARPPAPAPVTVVTVPGMPSVPDPSNLYSEAGANRLSPAVAGALERVYVPNHTANTVTVIDPATLKVVDTFKVGINPQHVVPSWDLRTLWVGNNAEGRTDGSLTPIDPLTGKPGKAIPVDDPYNMYWSPDGKYAIVVAEAYKRLDFRDPASLKLAYSIATPGCSGINHADFSIDGKFALFTCEFNGSITKIDLVEPRGRHLKRADTTRARRCRPTAKPARSPEVSSQTDRSEARSHHARHAAGRARVTRRYALLRRRHDGRRRARGRRRELDADGFHPHRSGRARVIPAATGRSSTWTTAAATASRQADGARQRAVIDFATEGASDLAGAGRREPRHGQCERGRQVSLAIGPIRRRGVLVRHRHRCGRRHQGGPRATRPDGAGGNPGRYSLGHTGNPR